MLFPEQCRRATALQRKGLLLKEIAAELDVSFEDVALYLFGGIADWQPLARAKPVIDNQEDDDDDDLSGEGAEGNDGGVDGVAGADAGRAAEPRGPLADGELADDAAALQPPPDADRSVREQGGAPPAPEPDRPVEPPAEPAQPQDAHADQAPVAPTAPAALLDPPEPVVDAPRRYRLTNGAGEYLHKSGSGMTRNKDAAWSGTAPQMEEAFKRKPTLKDLDPERVPG